MKFTKQYTFYLLTKINLKNNFGWENIIDLVKKLVDIDIWFYESRKQRITANIKTTEIAFERLVMGMAIYKYLTFPFFEIY